MSSPLKFFALAGSFLLVGAPGMTASSAGKELLRPTAGQKLQSPDKRFSVWLEPAKDVGCVDIMIQDRTTSEPAESFSSTRVSALYWTGDSRTIVCTGLLSGGPRAFMFHRNGMNQWVTSEINPPSLGLYQKEMIFNCVPGLTEIHLEFGILPDYRIDGKPRFYICSLNVDPHTGIFSALEWKPVTYDVHEKLKTKYMDIDGDQILKP